MHMHVCLLVTASLLKIEARECRYTHVGFGTPPKAQKYYVAFSKSNISKF